MLRRGTRDHLEVGDLGQPGEDFILHPFTKVRIVWIATEIIEWKDGNRFLWNCLACSRLALKARPRLRLRYGSRRWGILRAVTSDKK